MNTDNSTIYDKHLTSARELYNDPRIFADGTANDMRLLESDPRSVYNASDNPRAHNRRPASRLLKLRYSAHAIKAIGFIAVTVKSGNEFRLLVTDEILLSFRYSVHTVNAIVDMAERYNRIGYAGIVIPESGNDVIRVYRLPRGKYNDIMRDEKGNAIVKADGHILIQDMPRKVKRNKTYKRNRRVW